MTKERFREIVKRMHPDRNGGRKVRGYTGFMNALAQWAVQKKRRFNKCWCGLTISKTSRHCKMHSIRGRKVIAYLSLVLCFCGCQSTTIKPVLVRTRYGTNMAVIITPIPNPIASAPRRSLIMAAAAVVPASPVLTLQVATEPAIPGIDHLGNVLTNNPVYQHGYWRIDYSPDLVAWTFYTNATDAVFAVPMIGQQGFWRRADWVWVSP